jgi:hypothetical protein
MTPTVERLVKISWYWYGGIGHYREGRKNPSDRLRARGKGRERCMSLILLGLVVVALDVIALFNILFSSMSVSGKLLWALIVLLLPVVGMLLYFAVGQKA